LTRSVLAVLCEHLDIDEADTANEGEKEPRMVLRFPPRLAPVKVAVLPLQKKEELTSLAKTLVTSLRARGIVTEYDESASIGKRYRRQDEIGTPWCTTIDFDSVEQGTVTVRDRDSMEQVRIPLADVPSWVSERLQ
jgi:glycyl-tRNA synthetase